jgi:N-acyl-D-aspartate/D-glutamate deacylase
MGERGANNEPATEEDIAQMAVITRAAIEAGALGFSTSRTMVHATPEGFLSPAPLRPKRSYSVLHAEFARRVAD